MTDETTTAEPTEETVATEAVTTTKAPAEKKPRARAKAAPKAATPAASRYAIIETGGKQYRVKEGDRLTIERLTDDAGSDITFDRVLLVGGDGATRIGTPVVDGASVTARIDDHGRGEKIVVFKFKAKKRYRRRTGHRQAQTYVTITGISG
jgi:large subunit ribosomal protein L21